MCTVKINPRVLKAMLEQFTQDPACIEDSPSSSGRDEVKDHSTKAVGGGEPKQNCSPTRPAQLWGPWTCELPTLCSDINVSLPPAFPQLRPQILQAKLEINSF